MTNPPCLATDEPISAAYVLSRLASCTTVGKTPSRLMPSRLSTSRHGLPGLPLASFITVATDHVRQRMEMRAPTHLRLGVGAMAARRLFLTLVNVRLWSSAPCIVSMSTMGVGSPASEQLVVRSSSRTGPEPR